MAFVVNSKKTRPETPSVNRSPYRSDQRVLVRRTYPRFIRENATAAMGFYASLVFLGPTVLAFRIDRLT